MKSTESYFNKSVELKKESIHFIKNVKNKMKEKGLNQKEFAKLLEISPTCVSQWLLYKSKPKLTNIYKICKVLNSTFEDLIS